MRTQHTFLPGLLGLATTASTALATPHGNDPRRPSSPSQCSSVAFTLKATSQNILFSNSPDANNETAILNFVSDVLNGENREIGTAPFSGTFTINGVYCKPTLPPQQHRNVLQFLVHGITYNSTMWSGYHFGPQYSWHHAANAEGYHTLAIDRLGHGLNSKDLNPVTELQAPLEVEVHAQLLQSVISSSEANALDRSFQKIVYVGHSFGSQLGIGLARQHPDTISALVLTGWSSTVDFRAGASLTLAPIKSVHPSRYPASLSTGYLSTAVQSQREDAFYWGAYDKAIPEHDFAYEDIVTPGEFGGLAGLLQPVPGFTKPVMTVTGSQDLLFCLRPGVDPSECDKILEKSRADIFPDLPRSEYAYFAPRNTGHDLSLQYASTESFEQVHNFLNKYF